MDNTIKQSRAPHPMIIIAATAVTVFALAGTAGILGWIPSSSSQSAPDTTQAPAEALASSAEPAPTSPRPAEAAKPAPKPAVKAVAKPAGNTHGEPRRVTHAPPPPAPAPVVVAQAPAAPKALCNDCGVIESVREVEQKGEGSGLGAAAGGVLGGVLGHQVGGGRGRDVMTVVGAVGGAVAGHQVEKNMKKTMSYEITVRFEDGTTRTLKQASAPAWRAGDKVRVVNSEIVPNG